MTKINKPVLDMQGTGEKIKSLRKFNKISVSALQAIYNWESGKNMPSIDNLIVLAQVFDVTIESLIATNRVEVEVETASLTNLKSA